MADDEFVNPMVGIGLMIAGGVVLLGTLLLQEWDAVIIGFFMLASGWQTYNESQKKMASGVPVSGQPQDVAVGGWDEVGWIMGKVDNPDTFIIGAEAHERTASRQAAMNAEYHGDSIQEFRGDSVQEFRGDAVSNWEEHAPVGKPSAVPADFHDGALFWQNPTARWTDPFA